MFPNSLPVLLPFPLLLLLLRGNRIGKERATSLLRAKTILVKSFASPTTCAYGGITTASNLPLCLPATTLARWRIWDLTDRICGPSPRPLEIEPISESAPNRLCSRWPACSGSTRGLTHVEWIFGNLLPYIITSSSTSSVSIFNGSGQTSGTMLKASSGVGEVGGLAVMEAGKIWNNDQFNSAKDDTTTKSTLVSKSLQYVCSCCQTISTTWNLEQLRVSWALCSS